MQFCPKTDALVVGVLRPSGVLEQNLDIKNMVPWTYSDLFASSTIPGVRLPFIVDPDMIYLNLFLREVYLFEKGGEWNKDTVNHPKLSLERLYDEKKWHDRFRIF
jgi:hypothetical protein